MRQNLTDFDENPKGFGKISEGLVKCQRVWLIKIPGYGHHYSIINQNIRFWSKNLKVFKETAKINSFMVLNIV